MKEQPTMFQYLLALVTFPMLLAIVALVMIVPAKSLQGDTIGHILYVGSIAFSLFGILKLFSFWDEYGVWQSPAKTIAATNTIVDSKNSSKNEQVAVMTEDSLPLEAPEPAYVEVDFVLKRK